MYCAAFHLIYAYLWKVMCALTGVRVCEWAPANKNVFGVKEAVFVCALCVCAPELFEGPSVVVEAGAPLAAEATRLKSRN